MNKVKWLYLALTLTLGGLLLWLVPKPGLKAGQCLEDIESGSVFMVEDSGKKYSILSLQSTDNLGILLFMMQRGGLLVVDKKDPELLNLVIKCPKTPETEEKGK